VELNLQKIIFSVDLTQIPHWDFGEPRNYGGNEYIIFTWSTGSFIKLGNKQLAENSATEPISLKLSGRRECLTW